MRTATRALAAAALLALIGQAAPAAAEPPPAQPAQPAQPAPAAPAAPASAPGSQAAAARAKPAQPAKPARPARPARPTDAAPIAGQYLVTLSAGADVQTVLDRLRVRPLFVYGNVFAGFAARLTQAQVNLLRLVPTFRSIEVDAQITVGPVAEVAGPRAVGSWGLDRVDQRDLPLNNAATFVHDGSNVTAYIIDTGIDYGHAEFAGRARPGYDAIGDGRNGADCNGHGTHVAGTVGGATYGIARRVRLVSVRVLGCDGRGTWSGVVAGLDWVAANAQRPAVANASLGGTPGITAVDDAANAVADRGVFLSVAAGNDAADACAYSPARASRVFTVGATTRTDGYATFSNRGACVQLLAPGSEIVSARLGGGSVALNGTSMATPHVTGVAALFKQAFGDRTQAQLQDWFWSTATQNRISGMPANTPNYLLYSGGL